MTRPQQQEIARSERTPVVQESREQQAGDTLEEDQGGGRVPPDNRPGHHPEREQDKPRSLGGAGHRRRKR